VANLNVCGRDRDRAEEGSPPLESLDQCGCLRAVRSPEREVEANGVEGRYIGARLLRAIDGAIDVHAHASQRNVLVARDHVNQLDAARGDRGEKLLDRRDLFTRATVLHGTIDDEMMRARRAHHATEDISRSSADVVFTQRGGGRCRHGRQADAIIRRAPGDEPIWPQAMERHILVV